MSDANSEVDIEEYDLYDNDTNKHYPQDLSYNDIDNIYLDTLPGDIFRMILPHLNKQDILSLRIVNKRLNKKIETNLPDNILFNVNKESLTSYNTYLKLSKETKSTKTTKKKVTSVLATTKTEEELETKPEIDNNLINSLPKSEIFVGRLIFKNKINFTIKQMERSNLNSIGMIKLLDVDNNVKFYKYVRCIICKRIDQNGIYQMTMLKKLNHLVLTTNLSRLYEIDRFTEDSQQYRDMLAGIRPPGSIRIDSYDRTTQRVIYKYNYLTKDRIDIKYLNLLSRITTLTLIYDGTYESDILSYKENTVYLKKEFEYTFINHIKKLNIDKYYNRFSNDKNHKYIGFDILYMFKNLKHVNIKCKLNISGYYALMLLDNLEELHFSHTERGLSHMLNELNLEANVHAILHVLLKKVKVITISLCDLMKNSIYNIYNTNYNFFDKHLPDKDFRIGNIISYPNIHTLMLTYSDINVFDTNLPRFPNLRKLAISTHMSSLSIIQSLISTLSTLILHINDASNLDNVLVGYYDYEFNNIKELTLILDRIGSILCLHMFPQLVKLTLISKSSYGYSMPAVVNFIPHIKSIRSLRDLYLYNINEKDILNNNITLENLMRVKLPTLNISFNKNSDYIGNEYKIMKRILLKE